MQYFKLFACCKIVKGAHRSVIIDIQRGIYETIPNDLFDMINELQGTTKQELKDHFEEANHPIIDEYLKFLYDREFGFWCDSLDEFNRFPDISDEWATPFPITNAIIDIGNDPQINYLEIIRQIIELRIPHIQIRSILEIDFNKLVSLVMTCEKSNINTIQILIAYPNEEIPLIRLKKFVRRNLRINSLTFHSSPYSKVVKVIDKLSYINYTKKRFTSVEECGKVNIENFAVNLDHYTESLNHNTCLNRKICIDDTGKIKNCPSLKKSFGNIKNTKLSDVITELGFKTLWSITKDQIDVCKDCEFRHLCTDCRALIKDPSNIFSQPAKCNYNPYISKWKGEKGFISVEKWRKYNT